MPHVHVRCTCRSVYNYSPPAVNKKTVSVREIVIQPSSCVWHAIFSCSGVSVCVRPWPLCMLKQQLHFIVILELVYMYTVKKVVDYWKSEFRSIYSTHRVYTCTYTMYKHIYICVKSWMSTPCFCLHVDIYLCGSF